jgi:hypothetical protein
MDAKRGRVNRWTPRGRRMGRAVASMQRDGWRRSFYRVALRTVNALVFFKILRGVWVEAPDRAFCQYDERFTADFLSETVIRQFASDPENGMSRDFVDEALAKGDVCYGIMDGAVLLSYGWYSIQQTRIDPPEVFLDFNKNYVYMYKGFTHPRYRGLRLHAIGMTLALEYYRSKGSKGIVSYIESDNFDSLKSALRMGYRPFGSIYLAQVFGRTLSYSTVGCKKFGFRAVRQPAASIAVFTASREAS